MISGFLNKNLCPQCPRLRKNITSITCAAAWTVRDLFVPCEHEQMSLCATKEYSQQHFCAPFCLGESRRGCILPVCIRIQRVSCIKRVSCTYPRLSFHRPPTLFNEQKIWTKLMSQRRSGRMDEDWTGRIISRSFLRPELNKI